MSLEVKNTRELINPDTFKWKVLVVAMPGVGKTTWAAGAENPGIAASETGEGAGLLPIAEHGLDYVTPTSEKDFDAICSGAIFKDKSSIVLDSASDMCKTFIKDAALAIPRMKGNSDKRAKGVPELDDFGVMGEIFRRLLRKLLNQPKHIVVTATMRIRTPDAETGQGQFIIGPDLPGELMLGAPAMFDTVMILKTRQLLKDPKDAKSKYNQRYFITQSDGIHVAKNRASRLGGVPLLASEEIYDLETGKGSWKDLFQKIKVGYTELYEKLRREK
jgi:hypothetical protein